MIDIHCHILPGLDDGPSTIEDSVDMARAAVSQGIEAIVATPHHQNGMYNNPKSDVLQAVQKVNTRLETEQIPLNILPGQETRLNGDMITELEQGIVLPLNETRYVFVEFPFGHVPRYAKQMLFDLQVAGYKPVIVHPERNRDIAEHPSILYEMVKQGALAQVTAGSVNGSFSKTIQKLSFQLIDANLIHFVASDAHNITTRSFVLREAYQTVEERFGKETAALLMENNALLVEGKNVYREEPSSVKKKKFFGMF